MDTFLPFICFVAIAACNSGRALAATGEDPPGRRVKEKGRSATLSRKPHPSKANMPSTTSGTGGLKKASSDPNVAATHTDLSLVSAKLHLASMEDQYMRNPFKFLADILATEVAFTETFINHERSGDAAVERSLQPAIQALLQAHAQLPTSRSERVCETPATAGPIELIVQASRGFWKLLETKWPVAFRKKATETGGAAAESSRRGLLYLFGRGEKKVSPKKVLKHLKKAQAGLAETTWEASSLDFLGFRLRELLDAYQTPNTNMLATVRFGV